MRVALLTAAALIGFACNSLLTRSALAGGELDAASFTLVRLLTGAVTLLLLARLRSKRAAPGGSWPSALALAGYAVFFTLAYTHIGAGVGALILFGSVQVTMIGTGLVRGERLRMLDWLGVMLAIAGLLVFTIPGATAPNVWGTTLMVLAGVCWGVYSLAGRRSVDPLAATAGNFVRSTLVGVVFVLLSLGTLHATSRGLLLATASGSLASGVGYTLWYAALPSLLAWRAAILQLIVPVLTALAATVVLGEHVTARLIVASVLVVSGIGLTVRRG
jgi:drug/metabolite transporter (DMT)-like permease